MLNRLNLGFSVLGLFLTLSLTAHADTTAAASSAPSNAAGRTIALKHRRNLRSLDGLPVHGGVLRSGILYRSARLTHLSREDAKRINALHLATIVDVRVWLESLYEGHDSRSIVRHVRRLSFPIAATSGGQRFYSEVLHDSRSRKSIGRFFATLADPSVYPLLYHCGVGRDRTGTLTALLLDLLGTPREVIMDDYLASGKGAHAQYLRYVFREVDHQGGIEPFLRSYGVTDAEVSSIRNNLIVPTPASSGT